MFVPLDLFRCEDCTASPSLSTEILQTLRSQILLDNGSTKINICRQNVWEGARRALTRPNFNPRLPLDVRFMDDIGQPEGAVDQGGPRRELLQLLMLFLSDQSPVFQGTKGRKHLTFLSSGIHFWCAIASMIKILLFMFKRSKQS
jgi:hypothetical protein